MGRGTGASYFEINLIQHMISMREEVLYDIFLDIYISYVALYRSFFLKILAAYRVGTRAILLL